MESDFVLLGLPKDNIRDFGSYPGPMWVNKLYIFFNYFYGKADFFTKRRDTEKGHLSSCSLPEWPQRPELNQFEAQSFIGSPT